MISQNLKKTVRNVVSIVLSSAIFFSAAFFTGCTKEETDRWLNEIFGMFNYEVLGDTLDGEAWLKMHVIDVGQGDSILIQCGECNVLIDCGENGMGDTVLDYLHRAGVSHLDWIIGTHPHSDHIGGMDTVIKRADLTIDHVMMPQLPKWVVVGCESGPDRRPCQIEWVESIVEQCLAANVPVFVKQLDIGGKCITDINKFPAHLQIRQVPWATKGESK